MNNWELKQKILDKRDFLRKKFDLSYTELNEETNEMINKEVSEIISSLVELTNSSVCDSSVFAKAIFDGISKQHRFLQGEFWNVLFEVVKMYSETELVDGRNKFAKDICKSYINGHNNYLDTGKL